MSGGQVWYTSDLHFGHQKLAEMRGFNTFEEHDQEIVARWNAEVDPGDSVWVLGDACMNARELPTVGELNGFKHLVTGNHDQCWPGHARAERYQRMWLEFFQTIQNYGTRKVDGTRFLLSHFPYAGDHTEKQRHVQYRLRDEGLPLVHGHIHSAEIYNRLRPRQVHVGLDAWQLRPVSQEQVVSLVREVSGA
jgi:calcineurin-like phosphoesterase family protein